MSWYKAKVKAAEYALSWEFLQAPRAVQEYQQDVGALIAEIERLAQRVSVRSWSRSLADEAVRSMLLGSLDHTVYASGEHYHCYYMEESGPFIASDEIDSALGTKADAEWFAAGFTYVRKPSNDYSMILMFRKDEE